MFNSGQSPSRPPSGDHRHHSYGQSPLEKRLTPSRSAASNRSSLSGGIASSGEMQYTGNLKQHGDPSAPSMAATEGQHNARRRNTVQSLLKEIGISEDDSSNTGPNGASSKKNQYLLLSSPANQRFLSALGLNEDVHSKLPSNRKEIIELFKRLDTRGEDWITTDVLTAHLRSLNLSITFSEVTRLVEMCDLNKDGWIQPVDMVNCFQKLQPMQSVAMCMPNQLARAKHIADSILVTVDESRGEGVLDPEAPMDVLNDLFNPNSAFHKSSIQMPIKPKPYGPGLIVPLKASDHYADPEERMETMNSAMDWNNPLGTKPPGIEITHRQAHQKNQRLDRHKNYVDALTANSRARDVVRDNYEDGRIKTKIRQRDRYAKAALFGADLYERADRKKQNRMDKMANNPVHKQTFSISPRGTVKPVFFYPGTNRFYEEPTFPQPFDRPSGITKPVFGYVDDAGMTHRIEKDNEMSMSYTNSSDKLVSE